MARSVPSPGEPALVALAVVVAPHGVRGEMQVKLHNPASELLESQRQVWLRQASETRRVRLRAAYRHKQGLVVALDGCTSREDAEALRHAELCVERSSLPRLAEGEMYLLDMVGLEARTVDGTVVGLVEDTVTYPSVTALCVRCADGVREVPVLPQYVVELRPEARVVIVDRLEDFDVLKPRRRGG